MDPISRKSTTTTTTTFMHGTLHTTILDATGFSPFSSSFMCMWKKNRPAYVTIKLGGEKVAETARDHDLVWNQTFHILCAHPSSFTISITLRTKMSVLGRVRIPARLLLETTTMTTTTTSSRVFDEVSFPLAGNVRLRFLLSFEPVESQPEWGRGFGGFEGLLRGVTFPPRSGCDVVLYQDAHHCSSFRPPHVGRRLRAHRPRRLWEDVYKAIDAAKRFVYIAGWSLNPKLVLVRDPDTELGQARGIRLGELLKRKAEEGVAVKLMLWDDETSLPIIRNQGVMRTHDEDSFQFFKHTKVVCRLCPRLHRDFPSLYAHHQKTITVDAPSPFDDDSRRVVVSFIGGIDLCDGRYDTEEHSLFEKLNAGDFYQANIPGASIRRGGPREAWHDTHARVVGDAARDILINFEQRWSKQCHPPLLSSAASFPDLRLKGDDAEHWNVQVFRSIDHVSVENMPENILVEHSIHDAYVEAIRRANRFIYIENQYFMGGCHLWEKDQTIGCRNLIPVEIALKVASKIRARERFAVYIILPMWPEGAPESEAVQELLHWTRLTMSMMYKLIGEALRDCEYMDAHPTDYLNFFCLANREEKKPGELEPEDLPRPSTHYWSSQMNRRFMIYVHSKLMIVDDEYVLVGSANVNQRSMDGRRDTEIAVGCQQPGGGDRHGEVHGYRMSLWYEHTRRVEDVFMEPETVACVRRLRQIGDHMWSVYCQAEVVEMVVHLVSYPVTVSRDGSVYELEEGGGGVGRGVFPDTSAPVRGRRSMLIPPACTT